MPTDADLLTHDTDDEEIDELDALVDDLTEGIDELRTKVDELREQLDEASDLATGLAEMTRSQHPAAADTSSEIARRLSSLRLELEMSWNAIPDVPFYT
jgi:predicted  nucleic acid-binding Zn-ribbon protein